MPGNSRIYGSIRTPREPAFEEKITPKQPLFEDDAWRAAANYRTGNFENAVADLNLLKMSESPL